jgi:pimeloyl-ACP methyl ester carboxylesterase
MVAGGVAGFALLAAAVQVPAARKALTNRIRAGEGPSEERRARSWFKVRFVGSGGGKRVTTEVAGGDPGYGETAKMLAESALCLALDDLPKTSGQVTTAVAMGPALRERLVAPASPSGWSRPRTTELAPRHLGRRHADRGARVRRSRGARPGLRARLPGQRLLWEPVATELADEFRVVAYDVRGAGRSDQPRGRAAYRLERFAGGLRRCADGGQSDRPVHLLAHDWGSIQSWAFVTSDELRGRIASYVSISGPPLRQAGYFFRARLRRRQGDLVRQLVRSWYIAYFQLPWLPERGWRRAGRTGVRPPAAQCGRDRSAARCPQYRRLRERTAALSGEPGARARPDRSPTDRRTGAGDRAARRRVS